jgi:hypothetical protein
MPSAAKRLVRARYAVNASTCAHNMTAEAMPRPPAPSSGRPNSPNVSTQPSGNSNSRPPKPSTIVGRVQCMPSLR